MWKLFFEICDFFVGFIPGAARRERLRTHDMHDWRRKYNALRAAFPELNFRHTVMIKGGWNIGFIIDRKYVFKIRKKNDDKYAATARESRITNAFADIVPLRIPRVEIVTAGEYHFFKYDFIPGKNLTTFSTRTIMRHRDAWGKQLAEFIYAMHNARPANLNDLIDKDGDGWNHHDICNNIIVDKKTMKIIGIIDWEYAGWGPLETEFNNTAWFSKKMRAVGMGDIVRREYAKLNKK